MMKRLLFLGAVLLLASFGSGRAGEGWRPWEWEPCLATLDGTFVGREVYDPATDQVVCVCTYGAGTCVGGGMPPNGWGTDASIVYEPGLGELVYDPDLGDVVCIWPGNQCLGTP